MHPMITPLSLETAYSSKRERYAGAIAPRARERRKGKKKGSFRREVVPVKVDSIGEITLRSENMNTLGPSSNEGSRWFLFLSLSLFLSRGQ